MNDTNKNYRLRIAPSPTGYPHIGTVYQALFNYAYVHKYGGSFIVRIEDTDRSRLVEGAEDVIFAALDWAGLKEDESPRKGGKFAPYRQSERLELYHKYAQELVDKGHAEFAYYKKEEAGEKKDYGNNPKVRIITQTTEEAPTTVAEMLQRKDWVLRMKVPDEGKITVEDGIRGEITIDYKQISKQVLLKSDGFPTYHLAVVVDDHLMEITHILRAEEWIPSLPKHVMLYQYFGWNMPPIFHTATLRNPDKSKLSKRQGHTNVQWFIEEGYLPEAILNFLALLGWSHPEEKEIFSLQEFIDTFELKDIRPIAPVFDLQKLNWMNQQYIQNLSDDALLQKLLQYDPTLKEMSSDTLRQLMPLIKSRMQTLKEFRSLTRHFFQEVPVSADTSHKEIAQDVKDRLSKLDSWNTESILSAIREVLQSHKIKMPILYTIFTGNPKGLPLPESLVIFGKEKTLDRLEHYV